jgi:hypothetical protein
MRVLKVLGAVVVLVACAIGIVFVMGARLPVNHVATSSIIVNAPQAAVWQMIEDIEKQPAWRTGLVAVEAMPPQNGHRCWTEVQKHMRMPLCEDASTPPAARVVRIADPSLPFGGTWTYDLVELDVVGAPTKMTKLQITENGTTGPALYRFIGHYIIGEDAMIKEYESDVQKAAHH